MYSIKRKLLLFLLLFSFITPITTSVITAYATNANTSSNTTDEEEFKIKINGTSGTGDPKAGAINSGAYDVPVNYSSNLETATKSVFDGFADLVASVGAVVLTFGMGKLLLSFKDDNPGSKSEAIIIIMAGILVMGVKLMMTKMTGM